MGSDRYTARMNYRHAYHAGNFADVLKHMVLVALIESLQKKAAPFCYIDTHAGRGRYDLRGSEARKTAEADAGFGVLRTATGLPPLLWKWLEIVRACNEGDESMRHYPGSPWIAAHLMRPGDSAQLCELHGEEAAALRQLFHHDSRVHVHQRDGYEAMRALVPPKEKRGLVLIDPPFEAQDAEFRLIEKSLKAAMEKWPGGIYAIWYPIKLRSHVQPFHRWLSKSGAKRVLAAEVLLRPDDSPLRLNGTGIAIVNAPWKFDEVLRDSLRLLPKLLGTPGESEYRLTWLVEEGGDETPAHVSQAPRSVRRR
ncbi:23S rRNA (adenine2030-N6)-methyltransferase [Luteibacter sp. UNCMF366Tsu5.1]|nr:23S rRNA (adenine2030-N6)-methyltransferase [Luteibacter sp. UNCMF366Tsu5.1]